MNHDAPNAPRKKFIYKVVLTGGPCGGKTTSLARITNFFQSLGWKVYRVSEVAYTFMSGGLVFPELNEETVYQFQKNLIFTMMVIEKTFDDLAIADTNDRVIIVCDRGVMDSTAYMLPGQWDRARREEGWNETELRDRRYNQVIHMVSVAKGATEHYSLAGHGTRHEDVESAVKLDEQVANAWVGHPYYDVIDNSSNFEDKLRRMLQCICDRIGIDASDRLALKAKKLKFLVSSIDWKHPCLQNIKTHEFAVENRFLAGSVSCSDHSRIRSRQSTDHDFTYVHTTRSRSSTPDQVCETKRQLSRQTYHLLLHSQVSRDHLALYKSRFTLLWNDQYYQLDVFDDKRCPPHARGLVLLETFSTKPPEELSFPPFLVIDREVSGEARYRLFNLATPVEEGSLPIDREGSDAALLEGGDSPSCLTPIVTTAAGNAKRTDLLTTVMKGSFSQDCSAAPGLVAMPVADSPTGEIDGSIGAE